jgi:hypothetical protein
MTSEIQMYKEQKFPYYTLEKVSSGNYGNSAAGLINYYLKDRVYAKKIILIGNSF